MIDWPRSFCPMEITIEVLSRSILGPPSLTGAQQATSSSTGVWRATLSGIPLHNGERVRRWRALEAQIEGRSNAICVPFRANSWSAPVPAGGRMSVRVLHSDGTTFSDGAGYASHLGSTVVGGGTIGGSTLSFASAGLGELLPGHMFSVGCRLYRVKTATKTDGIWSVTVWPALREAIPIGARVDFYRLRCKMRLATDTEMTAPLLLGRTGVATVSFIEDTL